MHQKATITVQKQKHTLKNNTMAYLNKQQHNLYKKLCDEYNDNNIQRFASFQSFLDSKQVKAYKSKKENALTDILAVIQYAENDF